jgi:hypothetical protein
MRPSDAFKSGVDSLRRQKHAPRFDEHGMTRFRAQRVVLRSRKPSPQVRQDVLGDTERGAPLLKPPALYPTVFWFQLTDISRKTVRNTVNLSGS